MLQEFVKNVEDTCRDVMNEIHTSLPGKIESIDLSTGRVSVTPLGRYKKPNGDTIPYPQITGVPVIIPQCAQSGIEFAFPIKKGESCLIIISEQELDTWLYGEESESDLRFDLTNAICIPGLSKVAGKALVEACSTDSAVITNGDVKMVLSPYKISFFGEIEIKGSLNVNGDLIGSSTLKP